jgi:hypothetical protein
VRDNVTAGVLEPTVSKVRSLKSAFEAAVSLLRIDDAIQVAPGMCSSTESVEYRTLTKVPLQSQSRSVMATVIKGESSYM